MADYNNMKGQLSAVARKAGGSLAVRDINGVVKPHQVVESENMCTAFVVVGKHSVKEWETSYEKMCNFVVGAGAATRAHATPRMAPCATHHACKHRRVCARQQHAHRAHTHCSVNPRFSHVYTHAHTRAPPPPLTPPLTHWTTARRSRAQAA